MAVAVKQAPEAGPRGAFTSLPVATLTGVVYVLVSLAVVLSLIPTVWQSAVSGSLTAALGEFVNVTLLGLTMIAAAAGLAYVGVRLVGPHAPAGLRAGIFFGLLGVLLVALLTRWASVWFEHWAYDSHWFGKAVGASLTTAVGLVLLVLVGRFFFKPGFQRWLIAVEEQGWFSTTSYKRSQGVRVRRGTILGILILIGAGIYTMIHRGTLAGVADWRMNLPFTASVTVEHPNDAAKLPQHVGSTAGAVVDRYALRDANDDLLHNWVKVSDEGVGLGLEKGQLIRKEEFDKIVVKQQQEIDELEAKAKKEEETGNALQAQILRSEARRLRSGLPTAEEPAPAEGKTTFAALTLLPAVQFTLPLLLGLAAIWLAWRIVNLPVFADFLIATEAEMNKVSWASRRRLVQDTLVVLVAVVLMTIFLLLADILWGNLLRGIGVLRFGSSGGKGPSDTQQLRDW